MIEGIAFESLKMICGICVYPWLIILIEPSTLEYQQTNLPGG